MLKSTRHQFLWRSRSCSCLTLLCTTVLCSPQWQETPKLCTKTFGAKTTQYSTTSTRGSHTLLHFNRSWWSSLDCLFHEFKRKQNQTEQRVLLSSIFLSPVFFFIKNIFLFYQTFFCIFFFIKHFFLSILFIVLLFFGQIFFFVVVFGQVFFCINFFVKSFSFFLSNIFFGFSFCQMFFRSICEVFFFCQVSFLVSSYFGEIFYLDFLFWWSIFCIYIFIKYFFLNFFLVKYFVCQVFFQVFF